jgi:2-dehydro-3-deoxyphosphogluconate aldolase/(4S)-4-hydroxy-2-oxoglutarate aldolase
MARFDRMTVLNAMLDTGLVPIFYNGDLAVSKEVALACARGGARLVEFTNRGDRAWNVFTELIGALAQAAPTIILGAGTVLDAPTAAMYLASGANFIVGPNFNPEVARLCNRRKVAYIPGCGTVSEISAAEEIGAEIVKIFPGGQLGGPGFVKAVLGPMPWTRLMPASGVDVTQENVQGWIKAGAACLGVGSNLIRKDYVVAGNYDAIADGVRRVLNWIWEAKGG